jgi:hypothetical protein
MPEEGGEAFPALPLLKLRVPFYAAVGLLERLSSRQLDELIVDLQHEQSRRETAEERSATP